MTDLIPNLRHLRALKEIEKHRTISAASQVVHLSQPALTHALRKLENTLRVDLFDRKSDGLSVTEPGRLLLGRIDRLFKHLSSGAEEVAKRSGSNGSGAIPDPFIHAISAIQLRAISAMLEARSISMAARNLGLSAASVQKALSELELLSGIDMFIAGKTGTSLTPSGSAMAAAANLALDEWQNALAEIEDWLGQETGCIVVGSLPLARNFILPTAINAFCPLFPDVQIRIIDGAYDKLLRSLLQGEIDLIIGALREPAPSADIVQEKFIEPPLIVAARSDHPLNNVKGKISKTDLAAYPWVIPGEGTPTRKHFEKLFEEGAGVPAAKIVETGSVMLIRALLLDSDRLTLISPYQFYREVKLGLMKKLDIELPNTARPIGMTTRKNWRPTEVQKKFVEILSQSSHLTP